MKEMFFFYFLLVITSIPSLAQAQGKIPIITVALLKGFIMDRLIIWKELIGIMIYTLLKLCTLRVM